MEVSSTWHHVTRVASDNNINTLTFSQSVPHLQDIPVGEGVSVSEVIEHSASVGFEIHKIYTKFVLLHNYPTRPVGCHITIEEHHRCFLLGG